MPQLRNVFGTLTVDDNLRMGSYLNARVFHQRRTEIFELFPRVAERRAKWRAES